MVHVHNVPADCATVIDHDTAQAWCDTLIGGDWGEHGRRFDWIRFTEVKQQGSHTGFVSIRRFADGTWKPSLLLWAWKMRFREPPSV